MSLAVPICAVIQASQFNPNHTVTILDPTGMTTVVPPPLGSPAGTPATTRPAKVGDVYSIQPDGTVQGRPAGTAGAFEVATPDGNLIIFRPSGANGPAFQMPYTEVK